MKVEESEIILALEVKGLGDMMEISREMVDIWVWDLADKGIRLYL